MLTFHLRLPESASPEDCALFEKHQRSIQVKYGIGITRRQRTSPG